MSKLEVRQQQGAYVGGLRIPLSGRFVLPGPNILDRVCDHDTVLVVQFHVFSLEVIRLGWRAGLRQRQSSAGSVVEHKNHNGEGVAGFFSDRCDEVGSSWKNDHGLNAMESFDRPPPVWSGAFG